MKNMLATITLALIAVSASAQQPFTIKGDLTGIKEDVKVMLTYSENGNHKTDSTIAKKGVFTLSGTVVEPVRATIQVKSMQPDTGEMTYEKYMAQDRKDLFLEAGTIIITGDKTVKTASIKGGKTQADFMALEATLKPFRDKLQAWNKPQIDLQKHKNPKAAIDSINTLRTAVSKDMAKAEEDFLRSHNNSYASLDILKGRSYVIELPEFEPLYDALSAELKNAPAGKRLAEKIATVKKTSVGKPAIDFTQQTADEKSFSLASLKGKYVLVDFWASWCGPCRVENPHVVKAYNSYKDKNFEIVGVSLDDSKKPWLDAIAKDGLTWVHVSDLKGWKNEVALQYGINAVPQNFLLDPNGVIIAKNLRGEELMKKLGELIK